MITKEMEKGMPNKDWARWVREHTLDIQAHRDGANNILHRLIEAEMHRILDRHPSVVTIVKCMGSIVCYDKHGEPFGHNNPDPPKFTKRLYQLAELDTDYYSLTGHPLKLYRAASGALIGARDW